VLVVGLWVQGFGLESALGGVMLLTIRFLLPVGVIVVIAMGDHHTSIIHMRIVFIV